MNSRIVISDPHGCYKTLLALIAKLPEGVPITFAGDYIDKGPDSRKIVEFIKNGGYDCVRGNHEQMMIDELQFRVRTDGSETAFTDDYHGIWTMNGGDRCLESYRLGNIEVTRTDGTKFKTTQYDVKALKEHLAWLKTLPYYLEYPDLKNDKGDYLLVSHSTPSDVWDDYSPHDPIFQEKILWDRDPFPAKISGIYSVYGHTPQKNGATVKEHFACIDTGAYFNRQPYGKMTALSFPDMKIYEQENIED